MYISNKYTTKICESQFYKCIRIRVRIILHAEYFILNVSLMIEVKDGTQFDGWMPSIYYL